MCDDDVLSERGKKTKHWPKEREFWKARGQAMLNPYHPTKNKEVCVCLFYSVYCVVIRIFDMNMHYCLCDLINIVEHVDRYHFNKLFTYAVVNVSMDHTLIMMWF